MFLLYTISFFVMSLFYVCVLSLVCFFFFPFVFLCQLLVFVFR